MPGNQLAFELVQAIVCENISDRQTLRRCCQVSRSWRSAAKPLLFSFCDLSERDHCTHWFKVFTAAPDIIQLVRHIKYGLLSPSFTSTKLPVMPNVTSMTLVGDTVSVALPEFYRTLPSLSKIVLMATFTDLSHFVSFLALCGPIQSLHLKNTRVRQKTYVSEPPPICDFSKMHTLMIQSDAGVTVDWMVESILQRYELKSLTTVFIKKQWSLSVPSTVALVAMAAPTLRSISMMPLSTVHVQRASLLSLPPYPFMLCYPMRVVLMRGCIGYGANIPVLPLMPKLREITMGTCHLVNSDAARSIIKGCSSSIVIAREVPLLTRITISCFIHSIHDIRIGGTLGDLNEWKEMIYSTMPSQFPALEEVVLCFVMMDDEFYRWTEKEYLEREYVIYQAVKDQNAKSIELVVRWGMFFFSFFFYTQANKEV